MTQYVSVLMVEVKGVFDHFIGFFYGRLVSMFGRAWLCADSSCRSKGKGHPRTDYEGPEGE